MFCPLDPVGAFVDFEGRVEVANGKSLGWDGRWAWKMTSLGNFVTPLGCDDDPLELYCIKKKKWRESRG